MKRIADVIRITDTAITAGAKVGGSTKLDFKPWGGVAAAISQRLIPEAARKLISGSSENRWKDVRINRAERIRRVINSRPYLSNMEATRCAIHSK